MNIQYTIVSQPEGYSADKVNKIADKYEVTPVSYTHLRDIYQKKHRKVTITKKAVKDYLGKPVYEWEKDTLRDQIGVVHGLAWTAVGGVTLKIEVNVMPGKGVIQVTGSLGNVMKESAQAAISYILSLIHI